MAIASSILAIPVMIAFFVVTIWFVPWRSAALLAIVAPVTGAVGFMIAGIVQSPFYPRDPIHPDNLADGWGLTYFGSCIGIGAIAAFLAGRFALRKGRRSLTSPSE
jgi:hypothetical protein